MSDYLFENIPFTQNLIGFYSVTMDLNESFQNVTEKIPQSVPYIVEKNKSNYPHEDLRNNYELGNWDDQINYMVVEKADGDLEELFNMTASDFMSEKNQRKTV